MFTSVAEKKNVFKKFYIIQNGQTYKLCEKKLYTTAKQYVMKTK